MADATPGEVTGAEESLFQALRAQRQQIARREGVPAYVVAHDRSLRDIARLAPKTLAELQLAHGMGPAKARRYGGELLDAVRRHEPDARGTASAASPPGTSR